MESRNTFGMAKVVGQEMLTLLFILPDDKTKDMYNHGIRSEHCEFRFALIHRTLLSMQDNQISKFFGDNQRGRIKATLGVDSYRNRFYSEEIILRRRFQYYIGALVSRTDYPDKRYVGNNHVSATVTSLR